MSACPQGENHTFGEGANCHQEFDDTNKSHSYILSCIIVFELGLS